MSDTWLQDVQLGYAYAMQEPLAPSLKRLSPICMSPTSLQQHFCVNQLGNRMQDAH